MVFADVVSEMVDFVFDFRHGNLSSSAARYRGWLKWKIVNIFFIYNVIRNSKLFLRNVRVIKKFFIEKSFEKTNLSLRIKKFSKLGSFSVIEILEKTEF